MIIIDPSEFSKICNIIDAGSVVALPTDTVYGLVCKINYEKAIEKIYQIKNRSQSKPLQILVSDWEQAKTVGIFDDHLIKYLKKRFLKGQVTVVVKKQNFLNKIDYWQKQETIAIRVTNSLLVQNIINTVGPLAASSCNISGQEPFNDGSKIDLPNLDYVVSGKISGSKASTVYDSINKKIIRE